MLTVSTSPMAERPELQDPTPGPSSTSRVPGQATGGHRGGYSLGLAAVVHCQESEAPKEDGMLASIQVSSAAASRV